MPNRQSIRLKNYDYSQKGAYFVTVCTQDRECLFGNVVDGGMTLNEPGLMVKEFLEKIPERFPNMKLDQYVIMPNHLHLIIAIGVGANPRVRPDTNETVGQSDTTGQTHGSAPTLGRVMQWFKTMTTNRYIQGVRKQGWPEFHGKIWQRNYHDRIIRNDHELQEIRQYILDNPLKWDLDPENPHCKSG